ncbi:RrF2 family transcriptional regulator [Candidatus Omnitrophota bacterium]
MKLITRDTDYAFRALCVMAASNERIVSVEDLVKETSIPRPFLRKILQILNKKGIIKSYKGKGGGFAFLKPPQKILLTDLIEIFQGPVQFNDHTFKKKRCPEIRKCKLKRVIDEAEMLVVSKLKLVSIASLLDEELKLWQKEK